MGLYFELFGFEVETNGDDFNLDEKMDEKMDEKSSELTLNAITDRLASNYRICGEFNEKSMEFVTNNFSLIQQAYESHQRKDLRSLQMQGQKVFPDILGSLRIELSSLNEINTIGNHDTGIFTSKFITFALQQLEFENRESRLS